MNKIFITTLLNTLFCKHEYKKVICNETFIEYKKCVKCGKVKYREYGKRYY